MEEKKYELTDETIEWKGHILHRIKAIKEIFIVKKGQLGGFIEKEDNLSQEQICWANYNAKVYDNAKVSGESQIYNNAQIFGNSVIRDTVSIYGNAQIFDYADISGFVRIHGNVKVFGNAKIMDDVIISGDANICDNAILK